MKFREVGARSRDTHAAAGRSSNLALTIRNADVERLARDLARATGESLTEAVRHAYAPSPAAPRSRRWR
ncbi:MAG: type II toxin-antitoxin system VapB family antitoxin [Gemmatimonadaceae bacterium]